MITSRSCLKGIDGATLQKRAARCRCTETLDLRCRLGGRVVGLIGRERLHVRPGLVCEVLEEGG